jgi:hypothetical protein
MIRAPHVITISGTPTFDTGDFTDAISTTTKFNFEIRTNNGYYCDAINDRITEVFELTVNPRPRIQITDGSNSTICYGYSSDQNKIDFDLKGGISTIAFGLKNQDLSVNLIQFFDIDPTENSFQFDYNSLFENKSITNLTTTTILSITVTGTSSTGCGTPATLTETLTIVPHFIRHTAISGNLSQTHCIGADIDPVNFEYSSADSQATIIWGLTGNPGNLALTSTGTTLTLSGTIDPLLAINEHNRFYLYDFY